MSGKGQGKRSKPREQNGSAHNHGGKKAKSENGSSNYEMELHLDPHLTQDKVIEDLRKSWNNDEDAEVEISDKILLLQKPFTTCQVRDFVHSADAIEGLIEELAKLDFTEKNNDLYKFKQSNDLKSVNSPAIKNFKDLLAHEVKPWLHKVTGIDFYETIDLFCARYDYTDYLLCHDDKMEGRRIAYIWYLVPPSWSKNDGGTLDLFDIDEESGMPGKVVKSLCPSNNSFAFFEVNHRSFHQVAEVLTKDKTRMSIGGWFHAKPAKRPALPPVKPEEKKLELAKDINEEDFFSWVNPIYLDPVTQSEIQDSFESNSEINLPNFLNPDKFEAVSEALRQTGLKWNRLGPPNRRHYDALEEDDQMPEIVQQCLNFLKSDATFLLLSSMTGLKLHELASDNEDSENEDEDKEDKKPNEVNDSPKASSSNQNQEKSTAKTPSEPTCQSEIRRWFPGSYTLLRDDNSDQSEYALDTRMFFNTGSDWNAECGGYTSYLARGEDEELLTAMPEENSLNMVYRDVDSIKFVKRVTDEANKMPFKEFHDIAITYYE